MFKLVVEPIDGIQVGLIHSILVHCDTSKWRFKSTRLTSSTESLSHPIISSLFTTGTCLLEHPNQAGITQKIQGNILGMSANAWMQPPVLVVVCSGGVKGLHPLCVPHISCGSQRHKLWLADSRRMNSFKIEYWMPAPGPRICFLRWGIVAITVLCADYVNPQSCIFWPVIG